MTVMERTMNLSHRRIPVLLAASALTLGLAALPVGFGANFAPRLSKALAGDGHGNGHGNGNANGHASDNAGSNAADGNANGHASDNTDSNAADGSAEAGGMGALNAAHAVTDAQVAVNVATHAIADAQAALDAANTTGDQTQI